jgi:hypothetical protein
MEGQDCTMSKSGYGRIMDVAVIRNIISDVPYRHRYMLQESVRCSA